MTGNGLRVKVCGLRRTADAELAIRLGATHVGCVAAADSPRRATGPEIQAVRAATAGAAVFVLVLRGRDVDAVRRARDEVQPDLLQCHGLEGEAEAALAAGGCPLLRVRRVAADARALPPFRPAPGDGAPALLDGGSGGSGVAFRWALLGDPCPRHVFIAGGITPANVGALLRRRPWGIDVSSGVERAPGEKDHDALRRLFAAVRGESRSCP